MGLFSALYGEVKAEVTGEIKKGVSELASAVAGELGIDADAIEDCLVDFECGDLVDELGDKLLELKDEYLDELVIWTIEFGSEQVVELLIELGVPPGIANTLGLMLEDVAADAAGGALEALGLANVAASIEASSLGQGSNLVGQTQSGLFHSYGPGTEKWRSSEWVRWDGDSGTTMEFYDDAGWASGAIPLLDSDSSLAANTLPNPVAQAFQPAYQKTVGAMALMETLAFSLRQYIRASPVGVPLPHATTPLNWKDVPELSNYQLQIAKLILDRLSAIISAAFGGATAYDWEKTSLYAGKIDGQWFQPVVMVPRYSNYIGPGYPPVPPTNQDNPPGIYDSVYMQAAEALALAEDELPFSGLGTLEDLFQWVDAGLSMYPEGHPSKRAPVYPYWVQIQALADAIPEVEDVLAEAGKLKYDRKESERIQSKWEKARDAAITATVAASVASGGPVATQPLAAVTGAILASVPPQVEAEIDERTDRAQSSAQREFMSKPRGQKVSVVRKAVQRVGAGEPPPRTRESSTAAPTSAPAPGASPSSAPAPTGAGAAVPAAAGIGLLFILSRMLG